MAAEPPADRGEYVARLSNCVACHSVPNAPAFSGGLKMATPLGAIYTTNITPDADTGIGKWTDAQLAKAIREGVRPDGTIIGPPMPVEFLRALSDEDLASIIVWLRSQKPVKKVVAKSQYKIPLPPSYGPPVANVATPPKSDQLKYGAYLVSVGHCLECHTPQVKGRLDMTKAGAGGRTFEGPFGQSLSRNITPEATTGLGNWTDAEIERAVRTGVAKDGSHLKPPMAFANYAKVNAEDMRAILAYLKTLKPLPFGGQ